MITATASLCFLILSAAIVLALCRLMAGPTVLDRVIGFDLASTCLVGMIGLASVLWNTDLFIEIMMIFALLGFVATISFVSFLSTRPEKLDPGDASPRNSPRF